MKNFFSKKNIMRFIFAIYIVINVVLLLKHEPWRDEARAWILAKNLSIKDLYIVSKYDGHPILWHLILMPFAKLNFPYLTIQIINLIICLIAAFVFYFKTKVNIYIKNIILFTSPFIYVYSIVARNYCLILLFIVLIAFLYKKKYNHPYIFTFLLCLILNSPTISWGFAFVQYLLFNFKELIYLCKKKNTLSIKQIFITNIMFVFTTFFVVIELINTSNPDFPKPFDYPIINHSFAILITFSVFVFGLFVFIFNRNIVKEYFICLFSVAYQVIIFLFFYPSVLDQRLYYQTIIWLFLVIAAFEKKCRYSNIISIIFILFYLPFSIQAYKDAFLDYNYNFSSGKTTANWINENIDSDVVLIDKSIMCQSIIPYLKKVKAYDIYYEEYFNNLKVYSFLTESREYDLKKYRGNYIVVSLGLDIEKYEKELDLVFESEKSILGEDYKIYRIK